MKKLFKILKITSLVLTLTFAFFSNSVSIYAQPVEGRTLLAFNNPLTPVEGSYVPLAPIPGTTESCTGVSCGTTLPTYLTGMFKVGIVLAGVLAFLMIVLGGFQYLSTDALTGKEEGRERIERAIGGLVLALTSYIILYTINPNLVNFDLNFGKQLIAKDALNAPTGDPAALQKFIDAQNDRMARVENSSVEKENLANQMIMAADEGFYNGEQLSPEQANTLRQDANKLLSGASYDRTTADIATASNLGNDAASLSNPNLPVAQTNLARIKSDLRNGTDYLNSISGTPSDIDNLVLNASGKYYVLAKAIANVNINSTAIGGNPTSQSDAAIQMMRNINSVRSLALSRAVDPINSSKIDLDATNAINSIKNMCNQKGLVCRNFLQ